MSRLRGFHVVFDTGTCTFIYRFVLFLSLYYSGVDQSDGKHQKLQPKYLSVGDAVPQMLMP